ncbi:hypothetical protein MRB53_028466 [Persea americana]|uniref:Uncharacterized protein n=1 Tax=Persea americana TaxID=3435 RepID=A0ACC2KG31_PERAE|nr:hypothetical protein MRB53_028466 [Persea americana]
MGLFWVWSSKVKGGGCVAGIGVTNGEGSGVEPEDTNGGGCGVGLGTTCEEVWGLALRVTNGGGWVAWLGFANGEGWVCGQQVALVPYLPLDFPIAQHRYFTIILYSTTELNNLWNSIQL